MDKKAFSSVLRFMQAKPWLILGMIAAMLLLTFGEQKLSAVLVEVELTYADYVLAVIRLILQTALSVVLIFVWHKSQNEAAPFAAVDILKLFVTTLVAFAPVFLAASAVLVLLWIGLFLQKTAVIVLSFALAALLTPFVLRLYLRIDFFMNVYITGRSNGILSCIGESFRTMKGKAGRYFVFNLKYLAFFFLIEIALAFPALIPSLELPDGLRTALDIFDPIFLSVFMPYRFLLKCGYYDMVLTED